MQKYFDSKEVLKFLVKIYHDDLDYSREATEDNVSGFADYSEEVGGYGDYSLNSPRSGEIRWDRVHTDKVHKIEYRSSVFYH